MIDPYLPDRGNPGYDATHYELTLTYNVATNHLDGVARITVVPTEDLSSFALDLVRLRVAKVAIGRRALQWRHRGGKVAISLARPLPAGDEVLVEVRYSGRPGLVTSPCGDVGWEELADGALVAAQPDGACAWFPCNDLAAQKASFVVTATAPSSYRVVSNGALARRTVGASTTTWRYEQPEPTSPYLMTLHVGRYAEHLIAEQPVPIRAVVANEHWPSFFPAFARLPQMMDVFVDAFGPYPLSSGYTVVVCPEPLEIPFEAQSLATFGTNHLDGRDERLIAHELAHQWFGNSVTAAAWADVWLHEGFACYAEWLWSERSGGPSADRLAGEHHERLARSKQDLVIGDPGATDMFDDRVYKRGALTLHAVRHAVGDDAFFAVLRRWAADHAHSVVSTSDFARTVKDVTGVDVDALLARWLRDASLPALTGA